jgi:hypothetical protein
VPDVHIPESRKGVDILLSVAIPDSAPLTSNHCQRAGFGVPLEVCDRVKHMVNVHLLEFCRAEPCCRRHGVTAFSAGILRQMWPSPAYP